MKRLIVNADDLGADEARNEGIFQAIKDGVVTSVSILPNGPAFENALWGIRSLDRSRISIGIHFNLSEGKPLSSGLQIITGPDGCFRGKQSARALLVRRGNAELEDEIRLELAAQIAAFRNAGIRINHLDGHQHVHVLPAVIRPVVEGAKIYGIPWIRIPEEPPGGFQADPLSPGALEEAELFSMHAEAARPLIDAEGIFATNHFRGLYLKGGLPASNWIEFLEAIPHGLTELMVHPGRATADHDLGPFSRFSTSARVRELEALTDGRFRAALLKSGVELTPFPEGSI